MKISAQIPSRPFTRLAAEARSSVAQSPSKLVSAEQAFMRGHKVEPLGIATVGFFWCFLMWFSTAAFSPSIAATYHLTIKDLGLLPSSAIWMAPVGRIVAGWAADQFGAPRTFAAILAGCDSSRSPRLSPPATNYCSPSTSSSPLPVCRSWSAFSTWRKVQLARDGHGRRPLCRHRQCRRRRRSVTVAAHLRHRLPERVSVARLIALARRRLVSGARQRRQNHRAARCGTARRRSARHGIRLDPLHRHRPMLAYAMSFGLEIALNAWLPGYFAHGFHDEIAALDSPASPACKSQPARSRR